METYQLREHQEKAICLLGDSLRQGHLRPILQAPTGMGKTLIAVEIIKRALSKGKRVAFVVDRITLIEQTGKEFTKWGLDYSVIQGNHPAYNPSKPVQLASVQTLARRKNKPDVDLIIVDEAHSRHKGLEKWLEDWNNIPVVALSATPWTKGLGEIYDDLIVVEDTQSLIDKGYLSNFVAYGSVVLDLEGIKTKLGDYEQKELGKRVKDVKIVADVVKTWLSRGEDRQTVCFSVNVAHSQAIVDEFVHHGVSAAHIDAYTSAEDREEIFKRHDSGEIKILSNCGITTKGWDSPNTTCLILARPTKSLMLFIQMCGRVLRKSDCGRDAIILDHGRNIERLGFPSDTMPQALCNGTGDKQSRKKQEKKEKLPTPCEKCSFMSTEFICPQCGHVPEKVPNVVAEQGRLEKIEKVPMGEKSQWFSMLLFHACQKGYQDGWASHKYKEKFGVWPARKTGVHPVPPNEEVSKWIKYLNIKSAKAREPAKKCRYCGSTQLKKGPGKGPHHAQLRCEGCGRHIQWLPKPAI